MTNKEAIKFLKEPRMWEWLNVAQQIAIDMAIDALSQEQCENAISRQAAIDIVRHECGEWKGLAKEIVKQFNGLPPVQPKPKTGHWIFDEILDRNYYCSECKSMGVDYWDYCPYCGARMVEPQESEDKECDT